MAVFERDYMRYASGLQELYPAPKPEPSKVRSGNSAEVVLRGHSGSGEVTPKAKVISPKKFSTRKDPLISGAGNHEYSVTDIFSRFFWWSFFGAIFLCLTLWLVISIA